MSNQPDPNKALMEALAKAVASFVEENGIESLGDGTEVLALADCDGERFDLTADEVFRGVVGRTLTDTIDLGSVDVTITAVSGVTVTANVRVRPAKGQQ